MRLFAALLSIGLIGCGSPVVCRTRCGLELHASSKCDLLQAKEDAIILALEQEAHLDPEETCSRFSGQGIWLTDSETWQTQCQNPQTGRIEICTVCGVSGELGVQVGPDMKCIGHELTHTRDLHRCACSNSSQCGSDDHACWQDSGRYNAIQEVDEL